jgi:hypothetical protein
MLTAPPCPLDEAPLDSEIEPLGPPTAAPVVTETWPLDPDDPLLADATDTPPLEVKELPPLQTFTAPPHDVPT